MSDNVIHVRFGPGGGRRSASVQPPPPPREPPPPRPAGKAHEPYGELFSRDEVARLFGLSPGKLRYWAQRSFIEPSAKVGRRRFYTFQDLISIRAATELLGRGVPQVSVRRSVDALKRALPHVTRPLAELRVIAEGQSVVVRDASRVFAPETGQLHFDFEVRAIRDDVVRVLRPEMVDPERRRRAYELYLEGCRFDEDEATFGRAEASYREAILLDPTLANALTNWGNLCYRRGEGPRAEELYRRALAVDAEQPEAYYNLGFLAFERGRMDEAAELFSKAASHDPSFADARFNLAMALEELGRAADARPHWETYLRLDPDGPWAEIARRHLRGDWRRA